MVHKAASGNYNYAMPKDSLMSEVEELDSAAASISSNLPKDVTAVFHPVGIMKGVGHVWHRMKIWSVAEHRLAKISPLIVYDNAATAA